MIVDLFVLPEEGANIILGIQWLETLGKVLHDYKTQDNGIYLGRLSHLPSR